MSIKVNLCFMKYPFKSYLVIIDQMDVGQQTPQEVRYWRMGIYVFYSQVSSSVHQKHARIFSVLQFLMPFFGMMRHFTDDIFYPLKRNRWI